MVREESVDEAHLINNEQSKGETQKLSLIHI